MSQSTPPSGGNTHAVMGLLLFITGLLIVLVGVSLRSQADDTTTQATITNSAPTVNSPVNLGYASQTADTNPLTLTEGAPRTLYVFGEYTDTNSCLDVTTSGTMRLVFYRSGVSGGTACTESKLNCLNENSSGYTSSSNVGGSCTGQSDTTADYQFSVPMQYYIDATDVGPYSAQDWIAYVVAVDGGGAEGTRSSSGRELNTLEALTIDASFDFGNVTLGSTNVHETNNDLTLTNTGNDNTLDFRLSGTAMGCNGGGSIPVGNVKYVTTTYSSTIGDYTALSTSPAYARISLTKRSIASNAPAVTSTWLGVVVPSTGVAGVCSGSLTFTASAQE